MSAGVSEFESACNRFISTAEVSDIIRLTTSLSERLGEIAASDDSSPPSRRESMNSNAGAAARPSSLGAGAFGASRAVEAALGIGGSNIKSRTIRGAAAALGAGRPRSRAITEENANMNAAVVASANTARNERRRIAIENARADRERYEKALKDPLVAGKTPEDRMQWGTALSALEEALDNPGADPNSSEIRGFIDNRNRIRDEYLTPVSGSSGAAAAPKPVAAAAAAGSSNSPNVSELYREKRATMVNLSGRPPASSSKEPLTAIERRFGPGVASLSATNQALLTSAMAKKGGAHRKTAHQKHHRLARRLTRRRR